jgi:hypothetical protein
MVGRYDEWPNVIDFIEIKLKHAMDEAEARGREDVAQAIWTALSAYLLGEIDIVFVDGTPYMQPGPNAANVEPTVDVAQSATSAEPDDDDDEPFVPPSY